jgi:tRNA threonylcarbamoyl adenosine modification protein (Sua5/YciO/YrdC/YwlC family)
MMGEHLFTYTNPTNQRHLDQICQVLEEDGLLAIPAGSSWMFCCAATSRKAVARIQKLKPGRAKDKPFSLVCANISMAAQMASIDGQAYRLLNRICPGHFTVLLKSSRMLPKLLKNKRQVVGIRIPDEEIALAVVEHFGKPLVASSIPASADGTLLSMGYAIFEEHGQGLDLVVDMGEELPGSPTTILDMTGHGVEVIREGAGDLSAL